MDADKIETTLYAEFASYEQFIAHRMQPDESVDVYLAEIRKLAVLFGAVSDHILSGAFMAGLTAQVKQLLRASS